MKKAYSGQVTVFLSLILICVCGLICGLLESARTAGARCYLQTAAGSSMDSLFSQYHRKLWEEYRIFGLEHFEQETAAEEFSGFLQPYLEQENWYPFSIENCQVKDRKVLTDDSGEYFEQEILDYMKYGIWTKAWGEDSTLEALKGFTEAEQVSELTRSMEVQTKDAWKLEEALENIGKCLQKQEECRSKAAKKLGQEDGHGFCREGDQLIKQLDKVPGLVEKYENQADRLGERLNILEQEFQEKQGDFSESVRQSFAAELQEYRAYTDKDGERRRQITGLVNQAEERADFVRRVQEEAKEVEEYIDDWEPDDEDDELNTAALWRPVQRHFSQYVSLSLPFGAGIKDKEKEGLLKKLREMADRGILGLVLPEGKRISQGMINAGQYPSHVISYEEKGLGMLDKAMTAEYCQVFFDHFCGVKEGGTKDGEISSIGEKDGNIPGMEERQGQGTEKKNSKENSRKSNRKKEGDGLSYELEYLLAGKDLDEENFIQVVEELIAVREGLNFIYLLGDAKKRSEAKSLAMAVVGGTGILPLVSITTFLILGVWAFGESVADVQVLLDGGKVPLLKGREDWKLSLEGLLDFARKGRLERMGGNEKGMSYEQYLTIFLLPVPGTKLLYRMMDIMEMNLAQNQPGFRMADCAYRVDVELEACGKHVYFSLGLLKSLLGSSDTTYPVKIKASRAY